MFMCASGCSIIRREKERNQGLKKDSSAVVEIFWNFCLIMHMVIISIMQKNWSHKCIYVVLETNSTTIVKFRNF